LLVALWLIVALSVLAGAAIAAAQVGAMASSNRMALRRAEWAREACLAILQADSSGAVLQEGLDSVDLGNRVWCRLTAAPNGNRLNINLATPDQLRALFGSDSIADAILDWRDNDDVPRAMGAEREWYQLQGRAGPRNGPLSSLDELALVRGSTRELAIAAQSYFTTSGDGRVFLEVAPVEVIATLPGIGSAATGAIARARSIGKAPRTAEDLLGLLAPSERPPVLAHFAELVSLTAAAPEYTLHVEGIAGADQRHAFAQVRIVRLPSRLAIVGRESW
jgi:general secretion pathway protein K